MRPIYIEAFGAVTILTVILMLLNVHTAVIRFLSDRNGAKLLVYLGALVAVGSVLISISYRVIDTVSDANGQVSSVSKVDQSQ